MKSTIASGAAFAATAVALVLSGAVSASAEDKTPPKTADKPPTEKMACGGKNGCNAAMMGKDMDKDMDKPGAQSDGKAASGDHTSGGQK